MVEDKTGKEGKKMSNSFKNRIANYEGKEMNSFEEKQKRARNIVQKIHDIYKKVKDNTLTEEEKQEFLKIEKEWIPDDISYMLYYVIDTYIKTGKIESVETYQEKFMSKRKVEPNRNPEKIYEETQRGENDEKGI